MSCILSICETKLLHWEYCIESGTDELLKLHDELLRLILAKYEIFY